MDSCLPGSSVCGIFQAKILESVAISFSRKSSQSSDQTHISCIGRWAVTTEPSLFLTGGFLDKKFVCYLSVNLIVFTQVLPLCLKYIAFIFLFSLPVSHFVLIFLTSCVFLEAQIPFGIWQTSKHILYT